MFLIKWALLISWLFTGFYILPLKWSGLNETLVNLGGHAFSYAFALTVGIFILGATGLKEK